MLLAMVWCWDQVAIWLSTKQLFHITTRSSIHSTANDFESSPFHAVPAYPDLPMEEVYPRNKPADYEEVLFRKQGKGRVVYYCGDIGRSFWDYLTVDHQRLIENSVRWCMNGEAPVTLEGSGLIDITVWRNTEGLSIHLVNMTTVNAMRGPAREIIPVQDLVLHVRNDLAGEASVVFSHENSDLQAKRMDNYITIGIPKLKLHELIVIR